MGREESCPGAPGPVWRWSESDGLRWAACPHQKPSSWREDETPCCSHLSPMVLCGRKGPKPTLSCEQGPENSTGTGVPCWDARGADVHMAPHRELQPTSTLGQRPRVWFHPCPSPDPHERGSARTLLCPCPEPGTVLPPTSLRTPGLVRHSRNRLPSREVGRGGPCKLQ